MRFHLNTHTHTQRVSWNPTIHYDILTQCLCEQIINGVALQKGIDGLGVAVQIHVLDPPQQSLRGLLAQQSPHGFLAGTIIIIFIIIITTIGAGQSINNLVPVFDNGSLETVEEGLVSRQLAADRNGLLFRDEGFQGFSLDPVDDSTDAHSGGVQTRRRR